MIVKLKIKEAREKAGLSLKFTNNFTCPKLVQDFREK